MTGWRGRRFPPASWLLRTFGWRVDGDIPDIPKAVIVVAPHTSNWDFILGVLAKTALGLRVSFIGKHTLFRGPLGWWLRSIGGIPVDRSRPGDIVAQVVARFRASETMLFALAPEGTRRRSAGWKSGFHRIAREAGVPVVAVLIDSRTRAIRVGPTLEMGADMAADFAALARVYESACGVRPGDASPVALV